MNEYELAAVSTFLSYWPDEMDYPTLIKRLNNNELETEDDVIDIWQPFEYYPGEFIAECIDTLHYRLIHTFQVRN